MTTSFVVKVPKGMQDSDPLQCAVKDYVFNIIKCVFRRHGAVAIDTPVMELKETLVGKYGEDSKLIYDLQDQGGELLSLRYDLTVPFARYLAMNGLTNMKRYHIGKVYRRDNPIMTRGRFREFYQCDFDIAGSYDSMIPDAECIKIASEILDLLPMIGTYIIKVNHRLILNAIFEDCGITEDKLHTACSSIDKLDKTTWENIREEMINKKGFSAQCVDAIGKYVINRGKIDDISKFLDASGLCLRNSKASHALHELQTLGKYCKYLGISDNILSFDLSLARGLDYYTGMIMEISLTDSVIGSICGGGRYDNLVGSFSNKNIPVVGFSIGIERILSVVEKKISSIRASETNVVVCTIGENLEYKRLSLCNMLWAAGIPTECSYQTNPKIRRQLEHASEVGAHFAVIVGETEIHNGTITLKNLITGETVNVQENNLVSCINNLQQKL